MKLFKKNKVEVKNEVPAFEQKFFDKEDIFNQQIRPLISDLYEKCKENEIPLVCLATMRANEQGVSFHHCFHFSQFAPNIFYEIAKYLNAITNGGLFKSENK